MGLLYKVPMLKIAAVLCTKCAQITSQGLAGALVMKMSDQGHASLAKVPAIIIGFRIINILATTLGETATERSGERFSGQAD